MKKLSILFMLLSISPIYLLSWDWPQCRNTNGGSPEMPSTIYLGDTGEFGHDSWAEVNGKWPKWRVVIDTDSDISDGDYGDWSSYSNTEHKTNISPTFTSTGTWYWGMQVEYTDAGGTTGWYCRNNGDWHDMWADPTSNLTVTVNPLNKPTSFTATTQGSRRIDLSWTHDNTYTTVLVVAREGAAITDDPENSTQYSVGSSIGNGTVIYKGTGEQFTHTILSENTTYYYRIYTCNNDYYSTTSTDTKQNVTTDQTPVTYHTISSFSGSEGDFGTSENVGTDGNTNFYITWDSDYLYAAIFTDNIEFTEGHEKFNIAIDIDPGGSNGASIESFGGYNFAAKNDGYHKLDYIVQWDDDFTNDVKLFDGYNGSLDGGTDKTYTNSVPDDNKAVEVRIPWSDLGGRPSSTWSIILWSCWGNDQEVSYRFPTTNPTGDASTPLAVEDYYLFNSANSGINPGADGTDQSLPIELQSFTATADGQKVVLDWETASELDNSGFNIFRSSQENSGYYIINEELIEGAGNSSTKRSYQYIDDQVAPGNQYWYKLQDVSFGGETEMHGPVAAKLQTESNNLSAESYALYPVYPNPFNPATTIRFDMQKQANLNISIYNIQGQRIKTLVNEEYPAGSNFTVRWNGTDQYGQAVSAGVYLYKMTTSTGFQKIRKMVLVR